MNRQRGFPFAQEVIIERTTSLNEEQRKAIQAALKTLFEAALSLSEDCQDDKRES
jgi:F0F1-type ATP synthase delta subunit